jgi:hypothetical protein
VGAPPLWSPGELPDGSRLQVDNVVRRAALRTGLVDIKVAAIGEDWSGLRFVWRRELRAKVGRR